jgi:hypothetical protein
MHEIVLFHIKKMSLKSRKAVMIIPDWRSSTSTIDSKGLQAKLICGGCPIVYLLAASGDQLSFIFLSTVHHTRPGKLEPMLFINQFSETNFDIFSTFCHAGFPPLVNPSFLVL